MGSLVRFVLPVLGTEQVDGVKNDLAVLYISGSVQHGAQQLRCAERVYIHRFHRKHGVKASGLLGDAGAVVQLNGRQTNLNARIEQNDIITVQESGVGLS